MWDESEPLADLESDEYIFETPDLTPVLTGANRNRQTPNRNRQTPDRNRGGRRLAGKCNPESRAPCRSCCALRHGRGSTRASPRWYGAFRSTGTAIC